MPQISIIVPVYNTDKYLRRTLDALLNQTFGDIEIIAIDDGSTDDSLKILNEYAERDSRVVVITQKNSGPATARNKGLDAATGKYLMFCDSDDWYEPNMCQVMFDTIEKQKTDVVCCRAFMETEVDLAKQEKKDRLKPLTKYTNKSQSKKHQLSPRIITKINVMLWNKIWRHDLVKQYNIRFPDGHEHDDDAFWYMYAFVANDIFFLRKKLYHYVMRSGSIMSAQYNNVPKNKNDILFVSDYVLDFLFQNKLLQQYKETFIDILRISLVHIRPLFSKSEIIPICDKMNQTIKNILDSDNYLICFGPGDALLLKNKSYAQLYLEAIWYTLQRYTIKLFVKPIIAKREMRIAKLERTYKKWLRDNQNSFGNI